MRITTQERANTRSSDECEKCGNWGKEKQRTDEEMMQLRSANQVRQNVSLQKKFLLVFSMLFGTSKNMTGFFLGSKNDTILLAIFMYMYVVLV